MNWLRKAKSRLQALFLKIELDTRMDDEMRSHIEMQTQENIEAGMKPEEARYAALRQFGWVESIKETCREQRGVSWLENFVQDVRFGARMLRRNPGFTAVALLTLALGIGANTAIFSVIYGVLFRPLPYRDAQRLVVVWETFQRQATAPAAWPKFLDWREQNHVFDQIAVVGWGMPLTLTGSAEPEQLPGNSVTAGYFRVLGVPAIYGRTFLDEEERPGNDRVVVLTYGLWQRRFNSDPRIIGQSITLDGQSRTIIGVLPPDFRSFGLGSAPATQLFIPLAPEGEGSANRASHGLMVIAKLKPSVSVQQAEVEMNTIADRLARQYPDTDKNWFVKLLPAQEQSVGQLRPTLFVLMGAVGFVLLIACANVANLLLARATARRKEIAIRTALGAGRLRIVRQLLVESTLLALLGGVMGVILALWLVKVLGVIRPESIPAIVQIKLDAGVLIFTVLLSVATGMFFGLAPALHVSRATLTDAIKEGERGTSAGTGGNRARNLFVTAEVAFSLMLLIGAGLMIRSFVRLSQVRPVFNPVNVMAVTISPREAKYPPGEKRSRYFQEILGHVENLPGVEAVGGIQILPMGGGNTAFTVHLVGHPPLPNTPNYRVVTPDYFRAMNIPVVKGRYFTGRDAKESPLVVIINETFARRVFPNQDPLTEQLIVEDDHVMDNQGEHRQIVGIVKDIKQFGLDGEPAPEVYVPYGQSTEPISLTFVLRSSVDPVSLIPAVRRAVWEVNKDQALGQFQALRRVIDASVAPQRFNTLLLTAFGVIALVLAAVGIYGVIGYSVAQRTREIGIRIALGAQKENVLSLVLGQGMRLALMGVFIGVLAALGLTRVMKALLFEVKPTDPLTFGSVSLLLVGITLLACWLPARRATKVDPIVALRCE
jgi:predicted permease